MSVGRRTARRAHSLSNKFAELLRLSHMANAPAGLLANTVGHGGVVDRVGYLNAISGRGSRQCELSVNLSIEGRILEIARGAFH